MTKEQAFKAWIKAAENHTWGYDDLWNAACDWQEEQDKKEIERLRDKIEELEGDLTYAINN